ncbi:unnamed protein product [Euphydryas editha]|uniref:Rotatin n=1 Tax=Euphydryas editha TaxID=104508 RepID=A0AAU9TLI8_EUPED|nr:unnamed protein product [Euphydryas editha]
MPSILEQEVLRSLEEGNFLEDTLHIFVDFLSHKEYKNYLEPNVPLSLLERGSELEVRAQKNNEIQLSPSQQFQKPPPTAALVVANGTNKVFIDYCSNARHGAAGRRYETARVRGAASRALCAAAAHAGARAALAAARDCLYNLLLTLIPLDDEDTDVESVSASSHALQLLAELLCEQSAGDVLWEELQKNNLKLFHLLLQALKNDHNGLQEAAINCITQLARSISHEKCHDTSKNQSRLDFLNNFPSPHLQEENERLCAGDSATNDCQPEYLVEEFTRILMIMYQDLTDKHKCLSSQDERWRRVCGALWALQRASARARAYCVHRRFPRALAAALQRLRDALSLKGKPVEVIRNADHEPTLNTLNGVLTLITSSMFECPPAKNLFAEDIAPSLARLWPWCMMTECLRDTIMCLLVTFTNGCAKAWSSVCSCVSGRSVVQEVCALATREAARAAGGRRARAACLLRRALRVLRQLAAHHHCRTIIIKSDVLSCMNKGRADAELARLGEALARHGDGAAALLAALASAPRAPRPAPLAALAHAAHHHRLTFLQSPDLLEILSAGLLTGDTAEIVSAARAVWALAANNHRAKLVLRSAGIPAALQSSLHRLQRNVTDEATQRAIQLVTYTQTVLQTT